MAGHVVTGAAVVLRTKARTGGGELYLYKGAPVPDGVFLVESIRHAESLGLIAPVPDPVEVAPTVPPVAGTKGSAEPPAAPASSAPVAGAETPVAAPAKSK